MRRGQHTGVLHVSLEVPELAQADARNVDDVGRISDWHFRVRSFQGGAQRQNKIQEVVVQGK